MDLAALIEAVRQDVAPRASKKGIDLFIDLPADLPPVLADTERLRQILLILVGNAIKFTDAGYVRVAATAIETGVVIAVHDTGIGIAPDVLPFIFEAFRQGDSRPSRRHGGAGLGLAIAQKLSVLMEGTISVESIRGEGSVFTLYLATPPSTPEAPEARSPG